LAALLPYLSGVRVECVEVGDDLVLIVVRTLGERPVCCPSCAVVSAREHSRYTRVVADQAIGGRPVRIEVSVRRLYCGNQDCAKATFAEQVQGLTERYQRRTPGLRGVLEGVAVALAGRVGARLTVLLGCAVSWMAMLSVLMRVPLAPVQVPAVLCVDDFALRRGHRYGSLLIDAVAHRRIDVLADRRTATLADWLRTHPGAAIVCRDGSACYAEAVTLGAPAAAAVSDRWHLWHNLAGAVEKSVVAHAGCWNATAPRAGSVREQQTRERHAAVHALLAQGAGLLECTRRLGWTINCVKRYARAERVEDLLRPPQYRACLVDPYREIVRTRLHENVPITRILAEIAGERDLSLIQTRLLGILRDREPTMNELGRHLGLDKSSITGLVSRAQQRGLVARTVSTIDRRVARVSITDTGRELVAQIAGRFAERIEDLVADLAGADRRDFSRLASRIVLADMRCRGIDPGNAEIV